MIENSRLELKRAFTEEIKKELVAFANTAGGLLIIGLADDGAVIGVENPDQVSAQVTNMLRDAISPDITLISRVEIKVQDNKALIHVTREYICPGIGGCDSRDDPGNGWI
jgi:ATP-dependent DNA helicase RecG